MFQQKRRVKIPCNHPLSYVELNYARASFCSKTNADGEIYLASVKTSHKCNGCGEVSGYGFYCSRCRFGAHVQCIDFPGVINYPCHSRHPLKILPAAETIDYADGRCHFCREELGDQMYHCSICNFSVDVRCSINPPPLTIYQPKSHNHTFTLMATKVSYTCNACGMVGDRNPYVCLECNFFLHRDCIDLPRLIITNRHDHDIFRTYHLNRGDWECGVCRKKMDWIFGAFSCLRCPNYAVHSKCATREDVWDGEELEDKPEEEEEQDPYEVINEKEIIHFSHEEHHLRLGEDNAEDFEKILRCHACILPIISDPFFKCVQCEFFLHKACASLPRMKRNILHNHKLTLKVPSFWSKGTKFNCSYCLQYFDGFRYECKSSNNNCSTLFDARCGSIYEPFYHELHPHPLYRTTTEHKTCGACGKDSKFVLRCIVCEFALCMRCATLPRKLKHRCDDHFLSLHHGVGNSKGQLWCDICEGKTDPSVWYYGCDDCGVTLHIKCVLGDMSYLKPGKKYNGGILVRINNAMSRPICIACEQRCMFPFFLWASSDWTAVYACSMMCANHSNWYKAVKEIKTYKYW